MELSSSSIGDSPYSIIFDAGQIGEKYIRNNRGSGRKNLRCFPKCSNMGHVDRGFCGNDIAVVVFGKNISKDDCVLLQVIPLRTSKYVIVIYLTSLHMNFFPFLITNTILKPTKVRQT
jgi:hypothetical protein